MDKSTGEKVEIFNQVAETLKVRDLATLIAGKTGVEIRNLENPRKEDAENELQVRVICLTFLLKTYKRTATRMNCDVTYRFWYLNLFPLPAHCFSHSHPVLHSLCHRPIRCQMKSSAIWA
jgi:hypothetical protein